MIPILGLGLLVLSWWQPMHFLPWLSWHSEVLAFSAVFLHAFYVIACAHREESCGRIAFPVAVWPLVILVIVSCVQYLSGKIGFLGDLLVILYYLVMAILAGWLGFNAVGPQSRFPRAVVSNEAKFDGLAIAILVGAFGSVVLAQVQALSIWDSADWIHRFSAYRRPGGNLGQANHLATLSVMGAASVIYLCERRVLGALAAVPVLLMLLLGLGLSESRTGALSAFALVLFWLGKRRALQSQISWIPASVFTVVLLLAYWGVPKGLVYIHAGGMIASPDLASINTSGGIRLVIWRQLFDAFTIHPLAGWGLGEIPQALNAVLSKYEQGSPFTYAHNLVLDLLVGVGLPLTLLLVLGMLIWLVRHINGVTSWMGWFCLAAMLPVMVHSMLEFPFAYAYFLLPTAFLGGALVGLEGKSATLLVPIGGVSAVAIAIASLFVWSVVEYIAIEEDYRVARFEVLRVGQTPIGYERPKLHLLTQLDALTTVARFKPVNGMSDQQMALLRNTAMRFPFYATQNRYALALALNGQPEEAGRQLRVMLAMHGPESFSGIRAHWEILTTTQYPQLGAVTVPANPLQSMPILPPQNSPTSPHAFPSTSHR